MGSARSLHRKIDPSLTAKVLRGVKPKNEPQGLKQQKPPRSAATYRGARRNAALRGEVKGIWKTDRKFVDPIVCHVRHVEPRRYTVERFGKTETRPLTYAPYGPSGRTRRMREQAQQQELLQAAE